MANTLHVTGFAELEKRFRALPDKFQRKTATRMTRAAATVVRDDARVTTLFKDRTGALRRNITIRKSKKNQDRDKVIYIIGVEHGKTREVINGKVTYKTAGGRSSRGARRSARSEARIRSTGGSSSSGSRRSARSATAPATRSPANGS